MTLTAILILILSGVTIVAVPSCLKKISILLSNYLPKTLKEKYQNSNFYIKNANEYSYLLSSAKLSDKCKLGLINKKLINKLSSRNIINIVNNLKFDSSKLELLLNRKAFKKILKYTDNKITFNRFKNYEVLYESLPDNEKYKILPFLNNDVFVINKFNNIKNKINDSNKCKIICSLENDDNKLSLLKDIKSESKIYDILSSFKSFDKVESYVVSLNETYQNGLVSYMEDDDINKFLSKGLLIKPILRYTNKKDIFLKYFESLSIEDKIDILKCNKNYDLVLEYYKQIKPYLNERDNLEILLNIFVNSKGKPKKDFYDLLSPGLVKDIIESNEKTKYDDNVTMYKDVDSKITFGVELESSHENSELIKMIRKFNTSWTIKSDCSIHNGVEIVSPIFHYTQKDLGNLKYVCDFMENNDFVASNDCGGHIHIGFDYFKSVKELEMLYIMYTNTQDVFFDICNRKGSTQRPKLKSYAKPISNGLYLAITMHKFADNIKLDDFVHEMKELQQESKYFDINIQNAQSKRKNTIEFRFPNGEINYEEVLLNITLIIKLCMAAKKYAYINKFDEAYTPINLLQSDLSKDTRKNILLKMLFENDENLIEIYNERYEANNKEDVFERKYIINF